MSETIKPKRSSSFLLTMLIAASFLMCAVVPIQAQDKKPNILVIMGDDIGWFNVGAYHRGRS